MKQTDDLPGPVSAFLGLMLLGPVILGLAFWSATFAVESGRAFLRCMRGQPLVTAER